MDGRFNRRGFLKAAGLAAATAMAGRGFASRRSKRPNVLFIAVDDLRPQLGCYGHKQMISPNIDKLASKGVNFLRSYCQVPVCGASRASLLTGVRPTKDRFLGYSTKAAEDLPGALSIAQHFKNNGYHTISNGKLFHHKLDLKDGWSETPWTPKTGVSWHNYVLPESIAAYRANAKSKAKPNVGGPPYESADVPDNAYGDGKIADKAISDLQRLADKDEPFFLALGFYKPHLPFNAPKKYWDMYDRDKIDLADNPFAPKGAPKSAIHTWGELRSYAGVPAKGPLDDEMARTMIHGYYACVTCTDAQIGRVVDEVDRLGLRDDTIIVLWGDHGWNLGEHGLWCKHCNFETSLHSPLLITAPGFKGGLESRALTEYVDIYPSLCELSGIPIPKHLHGQSFVPLMKDPDKPWKKAVFSRYFAGDSVKTDRYRYTEWCDKQGKQLSRMLYDHETDPAENVNIAEKKEHESLVQRMSKMIEENRKASAVQM